MRALNDIAQKRTIDTAGIDPACVPDGNEMHVAHFLVDEGFWDRNIVTGKIRYDDRCAAIFGYAPGEIDLSVGSWEDRIHPDDRGRVLDALNNHLAGQTDHYTSEHRVLTKSGTSVWVLARGKVVERDQDGVPLRIAGTTLDNTERKEAAEKLRQSEERFRDFAEVSADWFWEMDSDLRIIYISPQLERITGMPPEWYYGKSREDLLQEHYDRDAWTEHLQTLKAHKPFRDFEFFQTGKGVAPKWLSSSGKPIFDADGAFRGYRGTGSDITEQKRAEDARHKSEALLRLVTDSVPVKICYVDAYERFQFVNETAQQWYNRDPAQIIGKKVEDIHGLAYEIFHPHIRTVLSGQNVTFEHTVTYADAATRSVRASFVPHVSPEKEVLGYFSLVEDITERRATQAQLQHALKMEAVGQLTGGVAHDFNNLLTAVLGNLFLLREEVEGNEIASEFIDTAVKATHRGASLTDRLLSFSRQQNLNPAPTKIDPLLTELSTQLLRRTIRENIAIETVFAPDTAQVMVDQAQLENAILNLAVNARDAMPDGGTLTIETSNATLDAAYAEQQVDVIPGEYVLVSVSDSGSGMLAEVVDHVFEPFFTTKNVGEGSGLGLSMVYGFIKQSGGHITIDSAEGSGTTVNMYLPVTETSSTQDSVPTLPVDALPRGKETILVVEDDVDVSRFVVAALKKHGYTVIDAADGPTALRLLGVVNQIDLLLTDVVLPGGMSGPQIATAAAKRFPDARMLYMSGYRENIDLHPDLQGQCTDLLSKPFTPAMLTQRVRQTLDTLYAA